MSTQPCQNFCCSAFIQYQDAPLTKTDILETEIHPLFAPEHFDQAIDYSLIELPLRLVSQWLKLDPVVRLIVVMTEGELKRDGAWKGSRPLPIDFKTLNGFAMRKVWPNVGRYATPEQDTVGPKMRQRAAELLLGVAGLIRFHIDVISGDAGRCLPSDRPLIHPDFPRGSKSTVFVGRDIYRSIEFHTPASGKSTAPDSPTWLLLSRFNLAQLLIHELFHALENLYNGARKVEFFYEDSSIAECGYAVENAIFGGLLTSNPTVVTSRASEWCEASKGRSRSKPMIMLFDWPSALYKEIYQQRGWKMACREVQKERSTKISRVPLSFLEAMFTTEFWQSNAQSHSVLQVPVMGECVARWNKRERRIEPWLSSREMASASNKVSVW